MIERIVLFKLKDEHATDATRAETAEHARRVISGIPGVLSVSAGIPADEPALRSWDLSLVVRFGSLEDEASYRNHPAHRQLVDEYLAPRLELVKAWNFRVEPRS